MKTSFLSAFLIGSALTTSSLQLASADDTAGSSQGTSSGGSTNSAGTGAQAQRFERVREALAQLDLSDAQKEQIKQIRSSVTDRQERRQQIMAVLTEEQKAKLRQLIQEHRNGAAAGSSSDSGAN